MDWTELKQELPVLLKKYAPAVAVLAVGLMILLLPGKKAAAPMELAEQQPLPSLQEQLEEVLSAVDGAGKVKVLLSVSTGPMTVYQEDSDTAVSQGDDRVKRETVLISGSDRNQQGLVRRVESESYRGAVVICQGADRAAVRLAMTQAVMTATGLTADKISILKMK